MLRLNSMLMIGSAGTNVGKTNLACALIKKFRKNRPIIGIKVTTIKTKDGQCPRGGRGCGVCSSLDGDFCIIEETESNSQKDTAKLLAAGASRVFWLRVMKTHLKEGLTTLLDLIGPDAISICESNSLRRAVKPGLFLMVKGRNLKVWKDSARQVKEHADRIVVAGTNGFDLDLEQIKLIDNRWTIEEKATAIIMAGGGSSRIGVDKSMLPIGDQPIIKHIFEQLRGSFTQILISANKAEKLAFLGLEVVQDRIPNQGPLMGLASVLESSVNELNFIVACDIPHIDLTCVRKMLSEAEEVDIVIPTTGEGKYEPLFAVYRKSALKAINQTLQTGSRKISEVFTRCKVKYIKLDLPEWFTNINTKEEYEEYRKKYDT